MYINHLIIGISEDGIDGEIYLPKDIKDIKNRYGWWNKYWTTLTAQSTSITLNDNIWDNRLLIYKPYSNILISSPLYSPAISGNVVTFGAPGTSGLYLFKYAQSPQANDLVYSYIVSNTHNSQPWVCRYPGTKANIRLGDLYLEAGNSGDIYNNITVSTTGSLISIYWYRENSSTVVYTYASSSTTLAQSINTDFYYYKHPLKATCYSNSPSIPIGTYSTTGGSVETFTSSGMLNLLDTLDLADVGILQIAGGCELEVYNTILQYLSDNNIDNVVVVSGTPVSYLGTFTQPDYISYIQNIGSSSYQGIYVAGWGQILGNAEISTSWTSLSDIHAPLLSSNSTPVNKKTSLIDYDPAWTKEQLELLKLNLGLFNRFIGSGVSCYCSNNLKGNSIFYTKSKLNLLSSLIGLLDSYIGNNLPNYNLLNQQVGDVLRKLPDIKDSSYTIESFQDTITINITYSVYGEVQSINLSLSSENRSNV